MPVCCDSTQSYTSATARRQAGASGKLVWWTLPTNISTKINLISKWTYDPHTIKLIRTNSTLYLSQKARKVRVEKETCPFPIARSAAHPSSASGVLLCGSVELCAALCRTVVLYLGGLSRPIGRREAGRESDLHTSCVTHNARNSCFKGVEIEKIWHVLEEYLDIVTSMILNTIIHLHPSPIVPFSFIDQCQTHSNNKKTHTHAQNAMAKLLHAKRGGDVLSSA